MDKGTKSGYRTLVRRGTDDSEGVPKAKSKGKSKTAMSGKKKSSAAEVVAASVFPHSSPKGHSIAGESSAEDGTL